MPVDIVEMMWECPIPTCKSAVLGRFKRCTGCGAPRPKNVKEWLPTDVSHAAAVKDAELLRKFEGGEDFECAYCHSSQFRADNSCAECGAPQPGKEPSAYEEKPSPEPSPAEETLGRGEVDGGTWTAVSAAAPTSSVKRPSSSANRPSSSANRPSSSAKRPAGGASWPAKPLWMISASAAAFVLLIAGIWALTRPKIVDATVSSVFWERSVVVERNQIVHEEGFDESRPSYAFDVRALGSRHHHDERIWDHDEKVPYTVQVPDGTRTVSYTAREACGQDCSTTPRVCTSNKNGSASCRGGDRVCSTRYCNVTKTKQVQQWRNETRYRTEPRYRMEPRYAEWYGWSEWRWVYNRTIAKRGASFEIVWPTDDEIRLNQGLATGESERLHRQERYEVTFAWKKGQRAFSPATEADFRRYPLGSRYRIKLSAFGGLEVLAKL